MLARSVLTVPRFSREVKPTALRSAALDCLRTYAEGEGFRRRQSPRRFEKTSDWAVRVFWPMFYMGHDDVVVTVAIGLRVPAIEAVFHKCSGYSAREQLFTTTIGRTILGDDQDPLSFDISSMDQISSVCERLWRACWGVARAFYDSFATISDVERALNATGQIPSYERIARGLIAARLVRMPDFDDLVIRGRSEIAPMSKGQYLGQYDRLVELVRDL
jgi:hypothetical protein